MYILLYILSIITLFLGDNGNDPWLVCIAQLLLFSGFLIQHFESNGLRNIHPMLMFAVIMIVTAIAHLIAFSNDNISETNGYFSYSSPPHHLLGMEILYWGGAFIMIGFSIGNKQKEYPIFAPIVYDLPKGFNYQKYTYFLLGLFFFNTFFLPPTFGYVSEVIQLLPMISLFFMARKGSAENDSKLLNMCMPVLIILTLNAVFFSYLRSEMLKPAVSYLLGIIIGKSSLKPLVNPRLWPIYAFLSLYMVFFNIFGEIRENSGSGWERIEMLEQKKKEKEKEKEEQEAPIVRVSLINQLSQIGRVVEEDSYYSGKTLEYFGYVFIPRILWPEKPKIAQGAWFAFRIGQARILENGVYTNSINMTVPGELFLNFGWLGLIIGGSLFGYIIAKFWKACHFWSKPNNFLGNVFALYLFMVCLNQLGADLQILITLIAAYLIFFTSSKLLTRFTS